MFVCFLILHVIFFLILSFVPQFHFYQEFLEEAGIIHLNCHVQRGLSLDVWPQQGVHGSVDHQTREIFKVSCGHFAEDDTPVQDWLKGAARVAETESGVVVLAG